MEQKTYPVEMISVCGTDGCMVPVRFRFEAENQEIHTVQVSEVVSRKEISHVGVEAILFVCKAQMAELERLLELKYTVQTHRWILFRVIY